MASLNVLFAVLALTQLFGKSYGGCPKDCTCNNGSTRVDCREKGATNVEEDYPASTVELILAKRNIKTVPWNRLKLLPNLRYLNLDHNPVDCDCYYYEYWLQFIRQNKVNVTGTCESPPSRRGQTLVVAGSEITDCVTSTSAMSTSSATPGVVNITLPKLSVVQLIKTRTATEWHSSSSKSEMPTTDAETKSKAVIPLVASSTLEKVPETKSTKTQAETSSKVGVLPVEKKTSESSTSPSAKSSAMSSTFPSSSVGGKVVLPLGIHSSSSSSSHAQSITIAYVSPSPSTTEVLLDGKTKESGSTPTPALMTSESVAIAISVAEEKEMLPTSSPSLMSSSGSVSSSVAVPLVPTTTEEAKTTAKQTTTPEKPTTTEEPTPPVPSTPKPTTAPPVPGPPRVTLKVLTPDVQIGSLARVECVVDGFPSPTIAMTVNGNPTDATGNSNGAIVTFVAKLDSEVSCTAVNNLGRDKVVTRVTVDRNSISYLLFSVKLLDEKFTKEFEDTSSTKYQNLRDLIKKQFDGIFKEFVGFYGASLIRVRSGSVIADVLIKTSNSLEASTKKLIDKEMVGAKLGSLSVDRNFYSFKDAKVSACTGQYLNTTWSDTIFGQMVVEKCPRGAKGFARRNCTAKGDWYYPDYTQCKSDPITKVQKEMKGATTGSGAVPGNKIQGILENLKNLTVGNEDYAHMAGDIITSVEIIERLVDYTRKERKGIALNEDEAKVVVQISSNLLKSNNEQEFIIAQKVVQTASDLIRVMEQYGLQSAFAVADRREELKFFIEENVVMGAGFVDTENITKDVTFPDYDIAVVDEVRNRWNASSFIVIDIDIIKLTKIAKKIKVAGFMYRTLTRILSAESAYSLIGQGYEVNSAVISVTLDPKPEEKFSKPIIIASSNLDEVQIDGDQPICAFWDFKMNPPNGGWSDEGCWYTHYNTRNTTCLCDHMTNFAVLRETPLIMTGALKVRPLAPPFLLCILIGCIIMVCFCGITLVLLLLAAWRMKPDRTWGMHMFVCATLIVAFVLIIVGLYSYNNVAFCNLLSMLVHYFYLCAFTWILAESIYMHVWSTHDGPKKRYWIAYFFIGFVLPGTPMVVTWLINGTNKFESPWSCWMILFPRDLIWVFFVPALLFTLITFIIFYKVWKSATGPLRIPLKSTYWRTRFRVHVRYSVAILIMCLLTWLMGVLVITLFQKVSTSIGMILCILFILFCAITGLLILVFYCIMDRQFDDAIRKCCCYCCRGRRGKYIIKGDDYWAESAAEEIPQVEAVDPIPPEEEPEMRLEPVEEPLIRLATRPAQSLNSLDDPLYERVRRPGEPLPEPEEEEEGKKPEPVYAKVNKPKRPISEEDIDPFPVATPGSPRFQRGLTRAEVIRMAKKSDASKRHLLDYESPVGSRDDLAEHPTYLLNQEDIDRELQHFRSFYAEAKRYRGEETPTTSTPTMTPPGTPVPRTTSTSSTTTRSSSVTKNVVTKRKKTTSSSSDGKTSKEESTDEHSYFSYETQTSSSSHTMTDDSPSRKGRQPIATPMRYESLPSPDRPPLPPPRETNLLDDYDDDDDFQELLPQRDTTASSFTKETVEEKTEREIEDDDESLTDVSADDLDKDDSDDDLKPLETSRATAV